MLPDGPIDQSGQSCCTGLQPVGEQAQLVTSKSSWMKGRMLYQLPPGSPSIPRPYKSRYTCTQQIRHQHRQARGGRRTGPEHQHRQVRGEPTNRPAILPPGPVWKGGYRIPNGGAGLKGGCVVFLMAEANQSRLRYEILPDPLDRQFLHSAFSPQSRAAVVQCVPEPAAAAAVFFCLPTHHSQGRK